MIVKTSYGHLFFDVSTGVTVLHFEPPRPCRCGVVVAFAELRPDGRGGCASCLPESKGGAK